MLKIQHNTGYLFYRTKSFIPKQSVKYNITTGEMAYFYLNRKHFDRSHLNDIFREISFVNTCALIKITSQSKTLSECKMASMHLTYDEIDIMMSQMDVEEFFNGKDTLTQRIEKNFDRLDEMDEEMSQMDMTAFDSSDHQVNNNSDNAMEQRDSEVICSDEIDKASTVYGSNDETGDREVDGDGEAGDAGDQSDAEETESDIPFEILQQYEEAVNHILPKKSSNRYLQAYEVFRQWQTSKNTTSFDEKVILCYFNEAAKKYKPSTVWSMYSMLKKTLTFKHNIDISKQCQLQAFLKTNSDGFKSKKSNVFTEEQVRKFVVDAPNVYYLGMKVKQRKKLYKIIAEKC